MQEEVAHGNESGPRKSARCHPLRESSRGRSFASGRIAAERIEFQPHSHSTFTVTALLAGEMAVTIGATDYELRAGEVALTNANQVHAGRADNVELVSVGVSPLLVNELVAEIGFTRSTGEIVFRAGVATDDHVIARWARAMATRTRRGRTRTSRDARSR